MKLKQILLGALPLLLLAACSNDNLPEDNGKPEQVPDGYIAVNLQLPTTSGTRAEANGSWNDQFEHGANTEYKVNEGVLVLFKGASETSATYCGAYDLGFPKAPSGGNEQENNVTVTYKRAVKVTGLSLGENDKLYGLVFLNHSQAGMALTSNGFKIGEKTCDGTMTFEKILEMTSNAKFYDTNPGTTATSIFMTNSPLSDTPGGSTTPGNPTITTLVELSKENLQETEELAEQNPAGTIYVERAVAKITCSKINGQTEIGDGIQTTISANNEENTTLTLSVKNVEWALGNEEPTSYIVRNISGRGENPLTINWTLNSQVKIENVAVNNPYRMIGMSGVLKDISTGNSGSLYRPYWCLDPCYNTDKNDDDRKSLGNMLQWNSNQVFYAHENTFDVDHQTHRNTTRVGMWLTFAIGDNSTVQTFYTRNSDKSTLYFDKNGKTPLAYNVLADLSKNETVKNAWKDALDNQTITDAQIADYINVDVETTDAGILKIKENGLTWNPDKAADFKNNTLPSQSVLSALIDDFNATYQFYEYKDGKAFYEFRIKHFGDDLTPWNINGPAASIEDSYPNGADRDNNYLGRYGLVRNNWYDIEIGAIKKLGDPRDPAIWDKTWDNTPDDNKDQYVALHIAVLSWAKRTQIVPF